MEEDQRVGVIADAHDHETNLLLFAEIAHQERFEEVWLAGDIGNVESYQLLVDRLACMIRAVPGNLEFGGRLQPIRTLADSQAHFIFPSEPSLQFDFQDEHIALIHDLDSDESFLQKAAIPPTLIISGHTHRPMLKKIGFTHLINPGSLAGLGTRPTFATIQFGKRAPNLSYWIELHQLFLTT